MKKYISLLVGAVLATSMSCEVLDMEVQDSPNQLRPDQFDLDAYVNAVQVRLPLIFSGDPTSATPVGLTEHGMEVTRMMNMAGPLYTNAYQPTSFDWAWRNAYSGLLKDATDVIELAEAEEFYKHAGMAKIIQGYMLTILVDYFGDIPYAEAFQGLENLNPNLSTDQQLYTEALRLLNEGMDDLKREGFGNPQDLYYNNDWAKWESLANTLKMKMFLQMKRVEGVSAKDSIQAIVASGKIIDTPEEDFQFEYSTNLSAPDSRHPMFIHNYVNGASDYMSNYFINRLLNGKGTATTAIADPRTRYYLYRQTTSNGSKDVQSLPCIEQDRPTHFRSTLAGGNNYGPSSDPFCNFASGYWGRDHGDNDGIPPDGLLRTTFGVYPFGGQFDANQGSRGRATIGAQGAGIDPYMLSSYVFFMRAEAVLTLNVEDPMTAKQLVEQGIRHSMRKVNDFAFQRIPDVMTRVLVKDDPETPDVDETVTAFDRYGATEKRIDAYVEYVMNAFDTMDPVEVAMEEYYLALFGNGIESYNLYRRTGFPNDFQPTLNPSPGPFIYSFLYPASFVNRNINANQKPMDNSVKPFWDKLGADLN